MPGTVCQAWGAPNGVEVGPDQVVVQMGDPNNVWVMGVKEAFKRYDLGDIQKRLISEEIDRAKKTPPTP